MEALPAHGKRKRTPPDFYYRAGARSSSTRHRRVRRVIRTPGTIADDDELERVRDYLLGEAGVAATRSTAKQPSLRSSDYGARDEPFALLHQLEEER